MTIHGAKKRKRRRHTPKHMSRRRCIEEYDARGRESPDQSACICVIRIVLLLDLASIKCDVSLEFTYVL